MDLHSRRHSVSNDQITHAWFHVFGAYYRVVMCNIRSLRFHTCNFYINNRWLNNNGYSTDQDVS